jgi:hypothetical protein
MYQCSVGWHDVDVKGEVWLVDLLVVSVGGAGGMAGWPGGGGMYGGGGGLQAGGGVVVVVERVGHQAL